MISRFALVIAVAAGVCGSALPAGAEEVGVGPVGVVVGDHDRDRDRDRDHKTVIIKKDHDGDRDTTVIKKRDHDRD